MMHSPSQFGHRGQTPVRPSASSGGISPEAEAWLTANPRAPRPRITPANADHLRATVKDGFAPAMAAARAEFDVDESDCEIGGVSCLEISTGPSGLVVLYFFGGGHTVGSPEEDIVVAAPIAAGLGARVIAPRYPLAPEHPYPAAVDSAIRVYVALLDQHEPEHVLVVGESAGGNLALAMLQRARTEGLRMPARVALLSPWSDLTFSGDSHVADRDPTLMMEGGELNRAAGLYFGDADPADPLISPIFASFQGFPPTLITTGTRDLLLSDCVRVAAAMRADGVDVDLRIWEGMWHVFEFYRDLPEARASMDQVVAFLRTRT